MSEKENYGETRNPPHLAANSSIYYDKPYANMSYSEDTNEHSKLLGHLGNHIFEGSTA